jgi:hypothetical protein
MVQASLESMTMDSTLANSLEARSNLIYLARKSGTAQQQLYMEWAEEVIKEMQYHPKVWGFHSP